MKKYIYGLVVLLVVVLFGSLYTYATAFHVRNVETITIGTETIPMEDESTQEFVKKLQSLKQYDVVEHHEGGHIKLLNLNMKYGEPIQFELAFDYNFTSLTIKDLSSDLIYLMNDEMVEWLYMEEAVADIYEYKEPKAHQITLNGQAIQNSLKEYHYTLADGGWYQTKKENTIEHVIEITKPELNIEVENFEGTTEVFLYDEQEQLYAGDLKNFEIPKVSGEYRLILSTSWKDLLYYGSDTSEIVLKAHYPTKFTISDDVMYQGEIIIIRADNVYDEEALFVSTDYMDGLSFHKNGNVYECVVPATYYTTPGKYNITYGSGESTFNLTFEVLERTFNAQHLTVNQQTVKDTQTEEAYAEYRKYYYAALEKDVYQPEESLSEEQAFLLPVMGRLTTEFGVRRYVNERLTSYRHAGLDIANAEGTDIMATYDGEVVLAMPLTVTGNSVVISHGNGIFSTYFHMHTMDVKEGDIVKTGDVIGTIGTTGFSTGPHLHFAISYHRMNLEPGFFIYGQAVTYDNYKDLFNGH